MVAEPVIIKNFRDWKGLHKAFPDRARPPGYSDTAQNVEIDRDYDITKSPGSDMVGHVAFTLGLGLHGLSNYVYFDQDTGATKQELFCLDNTLQAVKFSEETLTVTYSGGGSSATISILPTSSNVWEVDLKEDGTSVSGWPKQYGTGHQVTVTSANSLSRLVSDITAETGFSATATLVLGLTGAGLVPVSVLPLTLETEFVSSPAVIDYLGVSRIENAGIDTMTYPNLNANQSWPVLPDYSNPSTVSMRNVLYIANGGYLQKYDGQSYYRAGLPTPNLKPELFLAAVGALTGTFKYIYTYVQIDKRGNRIEGAPSPVAEITAAGDDIRMNIPCPKGSTVVGYTAASGTGVNTLRVASGAEESPGLAELKVGDEIVIPTSSGTLPRRTVTEIAPVSSTQTDITFDGATVSFLSSVLVFSIAKGEYEFNARVVHVNGAQSGVNTITINAPNDLQVGDVVYFLDRSAGVGAFVERNVTAVAATTVTIDGAAVDVSNTDPICNNTRIAIYRTKNQGSIFYLVEELPIEDVFGDEAMVFYEDDTPDANLGAQYIRPERDYNPPPRCRFIIPHQGLLIAGGDPLNPNRIYWSEPNLPEAWPAATNFYDIEFSSGGVISGLGIDNGALVVFKDRARAYVQGEIALDSFSVEVIEDGIGCPGHHSIAKTSQGLVWLSEEGFQRSLNGLLDEDFNSRLAIQFKDQTYEQVDQEAISSENETKLVFKRATAVNDYRRDKYICYVPAESGTVGNAGSGLDKKRPNANSKAFVYDYANDHFSEKVHEQYTEGSLVSTYNAFGGLAIHRGRLYFLSMGGETISSTDERTTFLMGEHLRQDGYAYVDNVLAVSCKFTTEWQTAGEPSVPIHIVRYKLHVDDPSLIVAPFTLTVNRYRNFSSTILNAMTKSFTNTTQEVTGKLVYHKSKAEKLEFVNNTIFEPLRLTGYEYEVKTPFSKRLRR